MNYLNEIHLDHPAAISFASGRPARSLADVRERFDAVKSYVAYRSGPESEEGWWSEVSQYGRTQGIIGDMVSQFLRNDYNCKVNSDHILITNGCQEGLSISLDALFESPKDVLLAVDPPYVGITGLCLVRGIPVFPVHSDLKDGINFNHLDRQIRILKSERKRVRAFYLNTDFSNPLGRCLSLSVRRRLIEWSCQNEIFILEDNPYSPFRYDGVGLPSLVSFDHSDFVIHLGTFSKVLCPSYRVGYLIVRDAALKGKNRLIERLVKIKSMTSVNTSNYVQAVVGGILVQNRFSLRDKVVKANSLYRSRRDAMCGALAEVLGHTTLSDGLLHRSACGISWEVPQGGFFLVLKLPVHFTIKEAERCAAEFDVLTVPLSMFALGRGFEDQIRLAFSFVENEDIREGIERLSAFISCLT